MNRPHTEQLSTGTALGPGSQALTGQLGMLQLKEGLKRESLQQRRWRETDLPSGLQIDWVRKAIPRGGWLEGARTPYPAETCGLAHQGQLLTMTCPRERGRVVGRGPGQRTSQAACTGLLHYSAQDGPWAGTWWRGRVRVPLPHNH